VKLQIDPGRCQGHGRCYDVAPELFEDDEEGYSLVKGDGPVPPSQVEAARQPRGLPDEQRGDGEHRQADRHVDEQDPPPG